MIERKFMVEIKSKVNPHSHKIMLNMPYIYVELKNQMTSFTANATGGKPKTRVRILDKGGGAGCRWIRLAGGA